MLLSLELVKGNWITQDTVCFPTHETNHRGVCYVLLLNTGKKLREDTFLFEFENYPTFLNSIQAWFLSLLEIDYMTSSANPPVVLLSFFFSVRISLSLVGQDDWCRNTALLSCISQRLGPVYMLLTGFYHFFGDILPAALAIHVHRWMKNKVLGIHLSAEKSHFEIISTEKNFFTSNASRDFSCAKRNFPHDHFWHLKE